MYCAGKMPQHVTRYNHKNQSRWLVMTAPPSRFSAWDVLDRVATTMGIAVCVAGAIVFAVFALRML